MKWTNLCTAVLALFGFVGSVNAGTCAPLGGHGADKGCGCAPAHQPCTSKPVICKPNHRNVCNYQRACSKQACGSCVSDPGCGSNGNGKTAATRCGDNSGCGVPGCAPKSMWDKLCGKVKGACGSDRCAPAAKERCAAPAKCAKDPARCAKPADPGCAAPAKCNNGDPNRCAKPADPGCAAPARAACAPAPAKACEAGATKATKCCPKNSVEVAHLICESQTACYARQRRRAIVKLGRLDCACNPEIMGAFAHALNDCDEKVRKEAAIQIRKQTRKNSSCCCQNVVAALTCALADCDRGVRREAEKALEACGYEVKECKPTCAPAARCGTAGNNCAPAATQTPAAGVYAPATEEAAPAVVPEAPAATEAPTADVEPAAYYPSRLKTQKTTKKSGLANLFGLR